MDCPFPVLPGSSEERSLITSLLTELDYHELTYMLEPIYVAVPIYSKATLIVDSKPMQVVPLPPSPSLQGRVNQYMVSELPNNPLRLKSVYEEAVDNGAELLILRGHGFGFISRGAGLSLQGNDYPPIPAVVVNEWSNKAMSLEAEIEVRITEGLAYNLIIEKQGETDDKIVVSTHLDSWPRLNDNCSAINVLAKLIRFIVARGAKKSIEFVIATARHFGDPVLPSMYWGVGHRQYFNRFGNDATLAIIFETGPALSSVASEEIQRLLGIQLGYSPFTAAVHPDSMGIPIIHVEGGLDALTMLESMIESLDAVEDLSAKLTENYVAAISSSLSRFGMGHLINKINKHNKYIVRRLLTKYLVIDDKEVVRSTSILDFLASTKSIDVSEVGSGFKLVGKNSPESSVRARIDDMIHDIRRILIQGE